MIFCHLHKKTTGILNVSKKCASKLKQISSLLPSMLRLEYNWLERIRKRIWNIRRHLQKNSSAVPNSSQSDSMEAWSSLIWGFAIGWNPASSLRILSISWRYSLFSRPDNPGESEQLSSSGYRAFCITIKKNLFKSTVHFYSAIKNT